MSTKKPKFTKKPWAQAVQEVDPKRQSEPTTAYRFSTGRTFHHKRDPYA